MVKYNYIGENDMLVICNHCGKIFSAFYPIKCPNCGKTVKLNIKSNKFKRYNLGNIDSKDWFE